MDSGDTLYYVVQRAVTRPRLDGQWDGPVWRCVEALRVAHFLPVSSDHRPVTEAKMVYDAEGVYGLFRVRDRYVLCTRTEYLSPVYRDACVEFFVQPKPGKGYMNFEMNCGGAMLLFYIEDPTRINDPARPDEEFAKRTAVPADLASQVKIYHSLPSVVEPEIEEPVEWTLEFHIPFALFEAFVGPMGDVGGQEWRANFNKCAEECSHPHWATWAPIGEKPDFHQPDKFTPLRFAE